MIFRIGGLPLVFDGCTDGLTARMPELSPFLSEKEGEICSCPLRVTSVCRQQIETPRAADYRMGRYAFCRTGEDVCVWGDSSSDAMIEVKAGAKCAVLTEKEGSKSDLRIGVLQFAFSSFLARNGGLMMHGAVLGYRGQGVIFTAPSGGGKTTHTRLWTETFGDGVQILNGDKAVVRAADGQMRVYGSPWAGSSDVRVDRSLPLGAIVILEKAKENAMERLGGAESAAALSPRVYYPYWDEAGVDEVLGTMDRLLSSVRVYRLRCLPDTDAARLCRSVLFSEAET